MHQQTSLGVGASSPHVHVPHYSGQFDGLVRVVQDALRDSLLLHGGVLFRVDPGVDLFEAYLEGFPEADRQYHNCNCCRSFIHRYGSLVVMADNGTTRSALWSAHESPLMPHAYLEAVRGMAIAVEQGRVLDRFLWDDATWGTPEAGGFDHMWAQPDAEHRWRRRDLTASQGMAALREDRRHLQRAASSMSLDSVRRAHHLLTAGGFPMGEKIAPMAEFLIRVKEEVGRRRGESANRVLWRHVATAPAGWCTPRSSTLGALVDDIDNGRLTASEVARRHRDRVAPLAYQRPKAAPTEGNVRQAEALVEKLGIAESLRRRLALASEVVVSWAPREVRTKHEGVFGHLLEQRGVTQPSGPARTMTWARFSREVLPHALEMHVAVPTGNASFCALTTEAVRGSTPILQWDELECRNPFAWYLYANGSRADRWNLARGGSARVVTITRKPCHWSGEEQFKHFAGGVLLVLEGCQDQQASTSALFPTVLRGELHAVRSTIEAHSNRTPLERSPHGQKACGLLVGDGMPATLTVRTAGGSATYHIDRES